MLWEDDTKLEELFWDKAKQLIVKNPNLASQKLKIPFLADPDFIKNYKPKKSYTLAEIGDNYFNRVNYIHKRELKNTRHSWTKFVSIVKVNTIIDLNREVIRTYFDKLYSEFKKGKSTSWIKNHFEKVKRIFNYAADSFDDSVELIEVKQRLRVVLKAPKDSVLFPAKKIPKEIFWQIIEASTTEESRSRLYFQPAGVSDENLKIMSLADKEFTKHPFTGVDRMVEHVRRVGKLVVNHKRMRRLMRMMALMAIYLYTEFCLEILFP